MDHSRRPGRKPKRTPRDAVGATFASILAERHGGQWTVDFIDPAPSGSASRGNDAKGHHPGEAHG